MLFFPQKALYLSGQPHNFLTDPITPGLPKILTLLLAGCQLLLTDCQLLFQPGNLSSLFSDRLLLHSFFSRALRQLDICQKRKIRLKILR